MSHPDQVAAHIQDTVDLYGDIADGTLPAVSIVKPSGYVDGHPASSKLNLFEGFVQQIVDLVQISPYADDTAIFITMDEGGGYYDSGYVQPLDFFGDGTRIIFLVVSPYLKSAGTSRMTTRTTSPSSNSSRGTGGLPTVPAAVTTSPTRSRSRATPTFPLTGRRLLTCLTPLASNKSGCKSPASVHYKSTQQPIRGGILGRFFSLNSISITQNLPLPSAHPLS